MLGFSAYLHSSLKKADLVMFDKFVKAGFKGVFTSINLPEDDPEVACSQRSCRLYVLLVLYSQDARSYRSCECRDV